MKLFLLSALFGCTYSILSCLSGRAPAVPTTCDSQQTKCRGPVFSYDLGTSKSGITHEEQKCGECEAEASVCADCDTDDCNVLPVTEVMECTEYEWKDDAWAKKMTGDLEVKKTCYKLKGAEDKCKIPIGKQTDVTLLNYCGECPENSEPSCKLASEDDDSDTDDDSGAEGVAATALTLFAALFVLS